MDKGFAHKTAKNIANGKRTRSAKTKTDAYHRNAGKLTQEMLKKGTVFQIRDRSGRNQYLLQVRGKHGNKNGIWEYVWDPRTQSVTHQRFRHKAAIDGRANGR
jgi:filamentous hemagglutinin